MRISGCQKAHTRNHSSSGSRKAPNLAIVARRKDNGARMANQEERLTETSEKRPSPGTAVPGLSGVSLAEQFLDQARIHELVGVLRLVVDLARQVELVGVRQRSVDAVQRVALAH